MYPIQDPIFKNSHINIYILQKSVVSTAAVKRKIDCLLNRACN